METRPRMAARAAVAVLAGALLAGCASTPVERQQATVQSLVELRDTMAGTRQQIEQTLAALITLMNAPSGQVAEAYRRYASAANTMAAQAGRMEAEAGRLRERREAWLAGWDDEEVRDPQLRSLTQERREQVVTRFDTIEGSLTAARESLAPFVDNLQDIKAVAGNDLSPLGLQALARTEVVRNATDHGRDAARALRVSTNELQALIQALAPARAAQAPR